MDMSIGTNYRFAHYCSYVTDTNNPRDLRPNVLHLTTRMAIYIMYKLYTDRITYSYLTVTMQKAYFDSNS